MQVITLQESEPSFRISILVYPPDSIVERKTVVVRFVITVYKVLLSHKIIISTFTSGFRYKNVLCCSNRGLSSFPTVCCQGDDNSV